MKPTKNSHGIAIIYVTLFLMVLGLLFVALGIDVGWLALVRTQGQAAVDAAALRGAAAIRNYNATTDPTMVHSMVSGLNADNTVMNQSAGLTGANVEFCTGDPDNPTCPSATIPARGIRVTKPYTAPLYFGKLFKNGTTTDITVSAIAWLGGVCGFNPDLPIALCAQQINYTKDAQGNFYCDESLMTDLNPNTIDNAGWYAIPDSANASICKKMASGEEPVPYVNYEQEINLNNGQITSCHQVIEDRFAAAGCFTPRLTEPIYDAEGNKIGETVIQEGVPGTQCTDELAYDDDPLEQACTVTLPVVTCENTINQQEPVDGFASVCISYIQSEPASDAVMEVSLNCNVTRDANGGCPDIGTNGKYPVLVK